MIVDSTRSIIGEHIKRLGYKKIKNGYSKQCKGGRLHLMCDVFNDQLVIELHYDKFKGNIKKKFHHVPHYDHRYVKDEIKKIKEVMQSGIETQV